MPCRTPRRRPRTHGSVRLHPLRARESGTTDTRGAAAFTPLRPAGRAATRGPAVRHRPPPLRRRLDRDTTDAWIPHPMQCNAMHASPRHRRHTCNASMTKLLVRTYSTVSDDSQYSTVQW
jgi:hypothetical protein